MAAGNGAARLAPALAIERLTTAERVAEALREELLSGALAPGTPIRDAEVSARAGVSRTTVREALTQLAHEGLLTHSLHRGMEVARLAPADIRDIYATRRVIERVGAEALVARPGSALGELEQAVAAMVGATADGDWRRVVEADAAFHAAIAGALGVRRLRAAVVGALAELRLVLSVTDRASGDLDDQIRQHRALLALFQAGSGEAAAALDAHLIEAEAMVGAAVTTAEGQAASTAARGVRVRPGKRQAGGQGADPPHE